MCRTADCSNGTSEENSVSCVTASENSKTARRSPGRTTCRMKRAAASRSKASSLPGLRLEHLDPLPHSFLVDLELLFGEVRHGPALLVRHTGDHVDQVYFDADAPLFRGRSRRRLRQRDQGKKNERESNQSRAVARWQINLHL